MTMLRRPTPHASPWVLFLLIGTILNTASSSLRKYEQDASIMNNNRNNRLLKLWDNDVVPFRPLDDVTPSRNLEKVDVNDIDNFFRTGKAPDNDSSGIDWPLSYITTITIDVVPLPRQLNPLELKLMVSALKFFYKQLFAAQSEYDIHIRSISIEDQRVIESDIVSFETLFGINFKPKDEEQILSNDELTTVLVHLMNKFDEYMTFYLRHQSSIFEDVESVSSTFESNQESTTQSDGWMQGDAGAIFAIVLSAIVMAISIFGSYILYRNETLGRLKILPKSKHTNISPFRESYEKDAPSTPIIGYGVGAVSKNEESVAFVTKNGRQQLKTALYHPETPTKKSSGGSPYTESTKDFSFPGGGTDDDLLPDSPNSGNNVFLTDVRLSNSPHSGGGRSKSSKRSVEITLDPEVASDLLDIDDPRIVASRKLAKERATVTSTAAGKATSLASKLALPMDPDQDASLPPLSYENDTNGRTREKYEESRRECFAPSGKLGVAIDTVDGVPVVHRLKDGSPLEGTLKRLDKIVAIDDVDTTGMSAADVTHLMVKGMGKERKITYIRRVEASDREIC